MNLHPARSLHNGPPTDHDTHLQSNRRRHYEHSSSADLFFFHLFPKWFVPPVVWLLFLCLFHVTSCDYRLDQLSYLLSTIASVTSHQTMTTGTFIALASLLLRSSGVARFPALMSPSRLPIFTRHSLLPTLVTPFHCHVLARSFASKAPTASMLTPVHLPAKFYAASAAMLPIAQNAGQPVVEVATMLLALLDDSFVFSLPDKTQTSFF